ncbi:hypothetical protein [Lactococcus lactis]|uniref:hypothetical protein n=1 Tax=Lactococcus lactis TaxID=1358 RepID=UPI001483AE4E|nr:hypothetical protein [Lactococcus lactis]MDT2936612.1 hypothetical protein [Lactococcus lactis]
MTLSGNKDKIKYSIGDVEYLSEELIQFIITISAKDHINMRNQYQLVLKKMNQILDKVI